MLIVEKDHRVLRLTLDRPERRNALNLDLCRALVDAFDDASDDPEVGAILLRANGTVFCSGMDLTEARSVDHTLLSQAHQQLFTVIERIRKPVVAAVQGPAIAGGTGLVANAHIVYSTPAATFGLPEVLVGLWPILVYRVVSFAIGERRTMEWSLTGRHIQAPEALAAGLVTELVEDPVERAEFEARNLATRSPGAIAAGFEYARESRGARWNDAAPVASRLREVLMSSPDFEEGVRAFKEKRAPRWPSLLSRG